MNYEIVIRTDTRAKRMKKLFVADQLEHQLTHTAGMDTIKSDAIKYVIQLLRAERKVKNR